MARLAPCYHGNKDWCDMVRTMEGEKRGRVGGKSPPAVQYCQQKPWGNLGGESKRQEFIHNFLSHTNIFVLQHKHWLVLPVLLSHLHPLLLHSAILYFLLPNSLFVLPALSSFCSLFSSSSLNPSPSPVLFLPPRKWISNDSGLVHSGEGRNVIIKMSLLVIPKEWGALTVCDICTLLKI